VTERSFSIDVTLWLPVVALAAVLGTANASPAPWAYVALGDSLTAGQGARRGYVDRLYERVAQEHPGAVLHNLGRSGATTSDVLRVQLPRVAKLRPELVTLAIGTNDLTDGSSVDQVLHNLETIIASLRATGAAVVVTNLPAVGLAPAVPAAYRAQIDDLVRSANATLEAICRRHGASLFDLYAFSKTEIPRHPEYFSWDGYHPSDEGYDRWAQTMWRVVKDALALHAHDRGSPGP